MTMGMGMGTDMDMDMEVTVMETMVTAQTLGMLPHLRSRPMGFQPNR